MRGEAHLWLLFEELLADAKRAPATSREPAIAELRRRLFYVSGALAAVGLVRPSLPPMMLGEFEDALALRGLSRAGVFSGVGLLEDPALPFDVDLSTDAAPEGSDLTGASAWLEAEIERHLDLLVDYEPFPRPAAGYEALAILRDPVRAFQAAGALAAGVTALDDLAATLSAAGFDPGVVTAGQIRREWVRYLRERPATRSAFGLEVNGVELAIDLGEILGRRATITRVAWDDFGLDVLVRFSRRFEPQGDTWLSGRALDDRGRLHLGQYTIADMASGTTARFRLRPGLDDRVSMLEFRLTVGGSTASATVNL